MNLSGKTFDDLLLRPQFSEVESRKTIDTSLDLVPGMTLKVPVMSAPMDTVTDFNVAFLMWRNGGSGIIPRGVSAYGGGNGNAVGLDDMERVHYLMESGTGYIVVDVAHGHSRGMARSLAAYKKAYPNLAIGAGNVATWEAARDLHYWGADFVKVGIGPGRACLTRLKTGFGVAQAEAIFECAKSGIPVVADGGIRNAKDIFMALALGARAVVLGSMVAATTDAPGKGTYAGVTAYDTCRPPEGTTMTLVQTRSLPELMQYIKGYLQSSVSYAGATSLAEAREKIMADPDKYFTVISEATRRESYER